MNNKIRCFSSLLLFLCIGSSVLAGNVLDSDTDWDDVVDGDCDDQNSAWWSSAEAIRIAENVFLYQKNSGGWPKNEQMQQVLSDVEKSELLSSKSDQGTLDNKATKLELEYLSKVYKALSNDSIKAEIETSFLKGIQFVLDAQYDNGGWPQFFPIDSEKYSRHITYNDGAMTNAMEILRSIYQKDNTYSIIASDSTVSYAKIAFDKGLECILKTQYVQNGILTAWCAQHHYSTLVPVGARSYELAAIWGGESRKVLEFLMSIDNPSDEIRRAIYYGVNWFDEARIEGQKLESFTNAAGDEDLRLVYDANAPDMWARCYTLENSTPFFCDRNGIKLYTHYDFNVVLSYDRREGYRWFSDYGDDVFDEYKDWYPKWGNSEEQETIIAFPVTGNEYLQSDTIRIIGNANEYAIGSIKNFELYLDDQLIKDFANNKIDTFITDVTPGTHTLVVKSTDNNGHIASDTCAVSVVQGYTLTINGGSGSGDYKEGTEINISADSPASGQRFDKWTGDTSYIADVNASKTVLTMPASNISLTATYTDAVSVNSVDSKGFSCYPNPTSSVFSIDLSNIGKSSIDIYSIFGQLVYRAEATKSINVIDNHNLQAGIYIIKVKNSNKQEFTQRLIIK